MAKRADLILVTDGDYR